MAARWWLLVAGLVTGAVVGYLLALGGGSVWKAQALLSLGQPFTPGSSTAITSYATNPRAVSEIVRSESVLKEAAHAAGLPIGALRGHISTGQVGTATGSGAARAAPLISLTVEGARPARVEKAANWLAAIVVARTTAPYVGRKIRTLNLKLASLQQRINAQTQTVTLLQRQAQNGQLTPLDRLSIVTQLNGAVQYLGTLQDVQWTAQQQIAFSENVESAKIVSPAAALKSTAHSHRTTMLAGALLGLILGAIAALLWEPLTARRAQSA